MMQILNLQITPLTEIQPKQASLRCNDNANIQPNFSDNYVWLIQPTSKLSISAAVRI